MFEKISRSYRNNWRLHILALTISLLIFMFKRTEDSETVENLQVEGNISECINYDE